MFYNIIRDYTFTTLNQYYFELNNFLIGKTYIFSTQEYINELNSSPRLPEKNNRGCIYHFQNRAAVLKKYAVAQWLWSFCPVPISSELECLNKLQVSILSSTSTYNTQRGISYQQALTSFRSRLFN